MSAYAFKTYRILFKSANCPRLVSDSLPFRRKPATNYLITGSLPPTKLATAKIPRSRWIYTLGSASSMADIDCYFANYDPTTI
jgi:hypothetical protein